MSNDVTQRQASPELDLIYRAIAKEDEACTLLVSYYQPRLITYVSHIIGETESARDIVQDVFSTCFSALHRWRPPNSPLPAARDIVLGQHEPWTAASISTCDHPLSPWLYKMSTHKALNWLRREKHTRRIPSTVRESMHFESAALPIQQLGQSSAPTHEDAVVAREVLRLTLRHVSELDAACVVLRFVEEESYQGIASRLGLTVEAARKRVARALPVLRRSYLLIASEENWATTSIPERAKNRGK